MIETRYRLARGVRLRHGEDGSVTLLVPEGIVSLNATAGAALASLAAGGSSLGEVVAALGERFDDPSGTLADDARDLLEALATRGYLER